MPTATANPAMNPKSLLLLCAGKTLSFGLVLAIMLAAVDTGSKRPARRTTRPRIEQEQLQTKKANPPRKERLTQRGKANADAPPTTTASLPSIESETIAPTTAPTPQTKPDRATRQQLSSLKKELSQELAALKKDRDAMLKALAQALVILPPSEIAQELSAFDDQSALSMLRQFSTKARGNVLDKMETKRAQRLRSRLK